MSYQLVRAGSLLEHLRFLVFVSLDLGFDCLPLYLDVTGVVLHSLVGFFALVLLQEALSVGDDRVHVSLVFNGDLQSAVPSVQLNVKLNGSVEETMLDQDSFSFGDAFLVDEHGSLSCGLTGELLLDVVNVLNLVSLVDLGEGNLDSVELSAVDTHGCEACPEGAFVDKAAKTDHSLKVKLLNVLIQHSRVGRHWQSGQGSIKASD